MSHVVVNPQADLTAQRGDEKLPGDLLAKLELFSALKKPPSFDKFPNSVVLRHYRPGDVICRQGDAGASAYYILTSADLLALRRAQVTQLPEKDRPAAEAKLAPLARQAEAVKDVPPEDALRQRATVHLLLAENKPKPARGVWGSLFGGKSSSPIQKAPRSIAIDGPGTIDLQTRKAPLFEGQVFGEMSCMTMSPRSATVVAETECYLLEFLRNIFDQIQRDVGYQQQLGDVYRERVLANHLKRLELLADVPDDDLAILRDKAELERVEPGDIIFDQGDRPDSVYLIRTGLVQVVIDPHLSLRVDDVLDWGALTSKLLEGDTMASPPVAPVAKAAAEAKAEGPATGDAPKGKPSGAEMLAAMRAKKAAAEAAGAAPTQTAAEGPPSDAVAPKPAKPSGAEMLAAMRAKKAAAEAGASGTPAAAPAPTAAEGAPSDPAAPKPAKPSGAEMLAAMRAKKAAAEAGAGAAPSVTPAAETPAPDTEAAPKPAKPSGAEMLAAMRAKKAAAEAAAGAAPAETPAAETPAPDAEAAPKPAKPSGAEMLAAMRAKKAAAEAAAGAAPPATPAAESAPSAESSSTADAAAKPAKPSAAEMLAAMRAKKAAADPTALATGDAPPASAAVEKPKPAAVMPAVAKKAVAPAAGAGVTPLAHLWQTLTDDDRAAVRAVASNPTGEWSVEKATIIYALNARLRDREWLVAKPLAGLLEHTDVAAQTRNFTKGLKGLQKDWTDLEVRVAGRILFELLLPGALVRRPAHSGPPRVLSYLSRGDIFGEMGVLEDRPRTATCVAYDHPPDPARSSVPVDLVRIPAEAFKAFVARAPIVQKRVEAILTERRAQDQRRAAEPTHRASSALSESPDFQELGLIQGQKLLLIDLDRCTRCGDCVRACVSTHDDQRSRLYLDGPRFDRYLVPSACRNCVNPACMIGCPVAAIQRGEDGQIEIRDWCIGCNMCAEQCPYDSIQMHELGLVPAKSIGWRAAPAEKLGSDWIQSHYTDQTWPLCSAPLSWNVELQALFAMQGVSTGVTLETPVCFRYSFDVPREIARSDERHEFELITQGSSAEVWLNGQPLTLDSKSKRTGLTCTSTVAAGQLVAGKNVLAVKINGPVAAGEAVLNVTLNPAPGELSLPGGMAEVKQVTQRAVVCDLCSSLPTGPACVTMCPHDAAFRVDARVAFPSA
jgi:CRP-like cAMP-binding protein/Fe-S-cluster-containing hydrogenase component 2